MEFSVADAKNKLPELIKAALAFTIVPKQEVIWAFFGPSDSLVPDCSIAVVLNPLSMLVATGLLIAGRFSQSPVRLRWRNLMAALRISPITSDRT